MSRELDVQVAKAIGWHRSELEPWDKPIPKFSEDWSVTGPLIERYRIAVSPCNASDGQRCWLSFGGSPLDPSQAMWPSLLESVCRLIVEIHKQGRLKAA